MNKWMKYGIAGMAFTVAQISFAEQAITVAEAAELNSQANEDMLGGSKLKDRMLQEGGPAVETVRVISKSALLKEVES